MSKITHFKVTPAHTKEIGKLALLGATHAQIADFFEITESQLTRALETCNDFRVAKKRGSLGADAQVAAALFKRAVGYTALEEKAFAYMGDIDVVPVKKHIPADVNAAKFWLKNREREKWRESPQPTQSDFREPWEIELQ